MTTEKRTPGMIDDLTYDIVTMLHEKSKGLEALAKYQEDMRGHEEVRQIFEEIRRNDEQAVHKLRDTLKRLLNEERKAA